MKTPGHVKLIVISAFGALMLGTGFQPKPSVDELQRVPWLWRFAPMSPEKQERLHVRVPTQEEVANQIVVDAQALLIRAAVLSFASQGIDAADTSRLVGQASSDCRRIAAARAEAQYVQSHAIARADWTMAWLPDREAGQRYDLRELALYGLAFTAIARDGEETVINPHGLVPEWDNGGPSRRDNPAASAAANYRPPEDTYQARDIVTQNLRKLLSDGGVSVEDINRLMATFADQSLGGIKYLEEFRDAIQRATPQP